MSKHLPPKLDLLDSCSAWDAQERFDEWYNTHIRPLFENAVEMYSCTPHSESEMLWSNKKSKSDHRKALLINIEPIKEETAEDLLREVVQTCIYDPNIENHISVVHKAKAFLAKRK